MIQRDYIERLTQEVAKVLARMIGKDWEKTMLLIEQVYHDWLPFERAEVLQQLPEDLLDWLIEEQQCAIQHIEVLAELLFTEGKYLFEQEQRATAKDRLKRAVKLFDYVNEKSDIYSFERQEKLEQAKKMID